MSSVAYATEEMMLVLALAGAGAFRLVGPLSLAVATLLVIVIISYRQTVRAYPRGGGAYIVSRENLGEIPGLVAASALLIDYSLTVAVSIAAGVAAITSVAPFLAEHKVSLALGFVTLVTLANLRGVKEAGVVFAIPTYTFVATIYLLIVTGLLRCVGGCPQAESAGTALEVESALGLFLVLRAFSSGATALTGVEAISDGVAAFRYPQSRNAAATLGIMGVIAVTMFLGISYLATATNVVATEGMERTVVAQIAAAVFGQGPLFYLVQVVTAAILILAANTAYADFPRLASILAGDRFLPRQFLSRGDRLVFSNGVLVLAVSASLLLVIFQAEVTRLIQLYVVGVFTSFTLSQAGMVRRRIGLREPRWRQAAIVSGVGAFTTGVVLVVVSITKFRGGAWMVILAIPVVATLMHRIHRHYGQVSLQLRADVTVGQPARRLHAVIVLDKIDESVARSLSYARAVNAASVSACVVPLPGIDVEREWAAFAPDVPLTALVASSDPRADDEVVAHLQGEQDAHPRAFTTAIVAETLSESMLEVVRRHRLAVRIKSGLVRQGVLVTNVTAPEVPGPFEVEEPVEHHVVVLVSAVNSATIRALAYAKSLQSTSVRALSVNLDTDRSTAILQQWDDWDLEVPLEIVDSPFRSLSDSVQAYVRDFGPDGRHTVVTCVLPEFVLPKLVHRPLHNQTALQIKGALLLARGVVVTSVPIHLDLDADTREAQGAASGAPKPPGV
jgi:amino acid transporter